MRTYQERAHYAVGGAVEVIGGAAYPLLWAQCGRMLPCLALYGSVPEEIRPISEKLVAQQRSR